jgi:hypothetical protein
VLLIPVAFLRLLLLLLLLAAPLFGSLLGRQRFLFLSKLGVEFVRQGLVLVVHELPETDEHLALCHLRTQDVENALPCRGKPFPDHRRQTGGVGQRHA